MWTGRTMRVQAALRRRSLRAPCGRDRAPGDEAVPLLQVLAAARLARGHRPHAAAHERGSRARARRSSRRRASRARRRRSGPRRVTASGTRASSAARSSTGDGLKLETTRHGRVDALGRRAARRPRPPPRAPRRARRSATSAPSPISSARPSRKRPSRPGHGVACLADAEVGGAARARPSRRRPPRACVVVGRGEHASCPAARASRPTSSSA